MATKGKIVEFTNEELEALEQIKKQRPDWTLPLPYGVATARGLRRGIAPDQRRVSPAQQQQIRRETADCGEQNRKHRHEQVENIWSGCEGDAPPLTLNQTTMPVGYCEALSEFVRLSSLAGGGKYSDAVVFTAKF